MTNANPILLVVLVIVFLLLMGSIIARCEHEPDNLIGFVVRKATTRTANISDYEILESGMFGSRLVITDSTGRFSVGDTLILQIK